MILRIEEEEGGEGKNGRERKKGLRKGEYKGREEGSQGEDTIEYREVMVNQ